MKKAFTLVEMLIVVVVLVTLMTMTFRLSSIGGSSSKRNATVARLQKLENCLSGYYAAFGMYPPVRLHGSRNPFLRVSDHGIQNQSDEENRSIWGWDPEVFKRGKYQQQEANAWDQVRAACRAQPVDCQFPFSDRYTDLVKAHSDVMKDESAAPDSGLSESRKRVLAQGFDNASSNIGRFSPYQRKENWLELQLFKFGLMSFLLPRYMVMMNADESFFEDYSQWSANNTLPRDPLNGREFPGGWTGLRRLMQSNQASDQAHVKNIPSQAVCARWMPNLEGLVYTPHSLKLFGVDIRAAEDGGYSISEMDVYSPGGFNEDSSGQQYILDFCNVRDGWWHSFYYYSPPPHQTYVLWSGGANNRTFPPWISRDQLDGAANKCIGAWVEDDIMSMSH